MRHEAFRDAIHALMACYPLPLSELLDGGFPRPFINVFGTAGHGNLGYRARKYPSNGTASTVKNWNTIVRIIDRSPIVIGWRDDYLEHLPDRIRKGAGGPVLETDAALWFFRYRELEEMGFDQATVEEAIPHLVDRFRADIGLFPEERQILFDPPNEQED